MWNMSSSYVRDCSNASGSSTSKTFIIIVNNEPGNVGLNDDLQSILATHGADPSSQVSVMQMGGGGNAAVPANSFGQIDANALPLNFTLDGFPTIPIEGVEGGYAELPLDMDALQRLESVLHTQETKEILGEPLMDDVNYPTPNQLADQLDKLNPSTDFKNYSKKKRRPHPERRSQRQMDKAEREEVEKILAENQLMFQREREELRRQEEEQQQQEQQQQLEEEEEEVEEEIESEEEEEEEQEQEEENYKNKTGNKKKVFAFKAKGGKITTADIGKSGKNASSTVDKGKGVKNSPIKTKGGKNPSAISKVIKGKTFPVYPEKNKKKNFTSAVGGKGKTITPTTKKKEVTVTTGSKGKGVNSTTGSKGKGNTLTTGLKVKSYIKTSEPGETFLNSDAKGPTVASSENVNSDAKEPTVVSSETLNTDVKEPTIVSSENLNSDAKEPTVVSSENLGRAGKEGLNTDKKSVYVEKMEDDYGIPKEVRMKKLSVKVKKLNEKLVLKQRKSLSRNNPYPSFDGEEQMGKQKVEDEGGDHGKSNIEPSSSASPTSDLIIHRATVTTGSSSTSIEETIEKGSTSPNSLVNKNSVSNSSLSTVQTNAVSESNRNNNNNNNNVNKLDITSSKILRDVLHSSSDLLTLSDKKSDLLNVNACNNDDKCESKILMPTQNFSDEANALSSHSQMDRSQANNDSSRKSRRDDINISSSVNTQYLSQVHNKNIQSNNKVGKIVAVLTPKAKREVYELKVVMQKENQNEMEMIETSPKKSVKKPHPMGGRMPTALTLENLLNRGSFASNKHSKFVKLKEIEKHPPSFTDKRPTSTPKILQQTPAISKSLMNYKIPLKNSAKRPSLDRKPEHLQNPFQLAQSTIEHSPSPQIFSPILDPSLSSLNTQRDTSMPNNFSQPNRKVILQRNNLGTPTTSKKIPASFKVQNNREQDLPNTASSHPQNDNEFKKLKNLKLKLKSIDLKTYRDRIKTLEESTSHVTPLKDTANPRVILLKETPNTHVTSLKLLNKDHKTLPPQKLKMNTGGIKIRRSSRPVKKKSFGDDILFLDEKTPMDSDDNSSENEEEARSNAKRTQNSDSTSDSEDESLDNEVEDDDPERLWCICKKPHNNRFMICCDRCEDWFHGACVGINKAMGKQMEEQKLQWICPNCKKAERAIKGVTTPRKDIFQGHPSVLSPEVQITNIVTKKKDKSNIKTLQEAKSKFKTEHRVLVYEKETGIVLSGTAAPTINLLPYWLKTNPEYTTLKPEMTKSIEVDPKTGVKRIDLEVFGLKPKSKPAKLLDRSFSFQEKIDSGFVGSAKKDKKYTVKLLNHTEVMELEKAKKIQQEKPPKTPKDEMISSPKKKRASSTKEKRSSIDKNDFYRRVSTDKEGGSGRSDSVEEGSSFAKKALKEFIKDPALVPKKPSLKSPEIEKPLPKNDSMNIRNSVKKMLYDALEKRKSEVPKEFMDLTEEALRDLCKEIEEQLFITFNKDVGFKYKSRYRSLIFNIKDSKNGGLFRQILSRTIPSEKLAVMTSEELASKELAEWREREEKKELEAIQKHELERIALGNQYIMKSHKGEIVIDKEELANKNKDTESVISLAPNSSPVANILSEVQEDEDSINHKNHIYDPSCKICSAAMGYNEFSKEELESKEKSREDESDKDLKSKELRGSKEEERKLSTSSRRESESSSHHHHHSKHKKKEKEKKHSHKSKEKEKDRERDKDYLKDKERSRHRSDDRRSKEREKHRSSSERERHKSSSEKERHKSSSKDDKRKKEDRKRRHSGSRKEDSKRRDSEDSYRRKKSDEEEEKENQMENVVNQKWKKDRIVKDENDEIKTELYEENQDVFKVKKGGNYEEMQDVFKGDNYKENKFDINALFRHENFPNDSLSPIRISNGESSLSHSPIITIPSLPLPPEEESFASPPPDLPQSPVDLFGRSPATPPLPVEDLELMSPATPPLPDDDDDRLTPPPSSTTAQKQASEVQIPIWKGLIFWPDVAKFSTAAFEVSGKAVFFPGEVPTRIEVIGRASPETVWSYIAQTKKSGSKEIVVIRFQPLSEEEKASYIAMYSYLASKKRFAVIGNCAKTIKDFYIVPLASHQPIPQVLLPLDGPGFEESRPHMLICVIVRFKHRRRYDPQTETWTNMPDPLHHRIVSSQERELLDDDEGESLSSLLSVPTKEVKTRKTSIEDEADDATFTPSPLSTEDVTELPAPLPPPPPPVQEDKKNKEREFMLAELNRQIERDRKEISEMQKKIDQKRDEKKNDDESEEDPENKDSSFGGDEGTDSFAKTSLDTSKINIPSNLHEILASIKKKEEAIREKENEIKRRLNMPEEVMEEHPKDTISTSSKDVDLRLLLGSGKDQDLRVFPTGGPTTQPVDQDFRSRDPRGNPRISRDPGFQDNGSSFNNMSENDHVIKVVETERPGSEFGTQRPHNSVYGSRNNAPGLMPLPGGHHHQMHLPVSQDNPPNAPYPSHELPPPGYRPPVPPFSGPPTDGMPVPPYIPEHSTGPPPGGPSQPLLCAPPGPASHPPFGHPGPAGHPGPLGHPTPPVPPGPVGHAGPPPGPSFGPPRDQMLGSSFEEYIARPPHEEYPARPPHEEYPARPPHEEYPRRPPHQYASRPPHEEYPGRPPHEEYPGRPPHEEYPGRPPHEEYQGRPPHEEYPVRPPHEEYPGRPSHEGYSQRPPNEEYPPYSRPHEDRRQRGEDERGQKGGSWERRGHRDPNWVGGNDRRWDRNDNNRWGHRNKPDRFSNDGGDRKRRWNDGGAGPPHNRGRWGEDEEYKREDKNWRNNEGKRHRKDRWYENSDKESGEREIDY